MSDDVATRVSQHAHAVARRRTRDIHDAEDAAQNACLALLEAGGSIECVEGWIAKVVRVELACARTERLAPLDTATAVQSVGDHHRARAEVCARLRERLHATLAQWLPMLTERQRRLLEVLLGGDAWTEAESRTSVIAELGRKLRLALSETG